MAAIHLLPLPDRLASLPVALSGMVLVMATAIVAARLTRRLTPQGGASGPAITALAVGLCYPLIFWTVRGMEVGLLSLLIVMAVDTACEVVDRESSEIRLLIVLALLTLVRPDAILPAIVVAVSTASVIWRNRWRTAMWVCVVPCAVLAGHTLFRLMYYGSALPNTYYLKMTGFGAGVRIERGGEVLRMSARYLAVPFLLAAIDRRLYRNAVTSLVVTLPLSLAFYTIYVGGDAWEWMPYPDRYLTPALPLLLTGAAATAAVTIDRFLSRGAMPACVAAAIVLIAIVSGPGYADWLRTRGAHVVDDANMAWMGVRVGQTTTPSTRIAVAWAGLVPYFSRRPSIDFLGKSDPVIARHRPVTEFYPGHDRFDYDYSIGVLKPDLVVQLWFPPGNLFSKLAAWNYVQVFGGVFAHRGAAVDVPRLRDAFREPPIS
jgi:hypothetical protein